MFGNNFYQPQQYVPMQPMAQNMNMSAPVQMTPQPQPQQTNQMPQQPAQPANFIKNYQVPQTQERAECFYVDSAKDMQSMNTEPNIVYIGINKTAKEVYIRSWNNDGNIDFETYTKSSGKQEKDTLHSIMDKLDDILNKLPNQSKGVKGYDERATTAVNAKSNARANAKQPNDELI